MSAPTVVPTVYIYAGDTCVFPTYTFLTDTVPVDLSDYTWTAQWRLSRDSAESIALTVDDSGAAVGEINILATPANSLPSSPKRLAPSQPLASSATPSASTTRGNNQPERHHHD